MHSLCVRAQRFKKVRTQERDPLVQVIVKIVYNIIFKMFSFQKPKNKNKIEKVEKIKKIKYHLN